MHTIVYAIAGYLFLLLVVRLLSRRPGAQMTPFEFVIVFLIGGVLILCTVGDDRSETNSVCAIITVGLMHRLVARLRIIYPWFAILIDGTPLVAYNHGECQTEVMQNMRLQDEDVMAAARTKGLKNASQMKYAILERNGAISIIKNDSTED